MIQIVFIVLGVPNYYSSNDEILGIYDDFDLAEKAKKDLKRNFIMI